MHEIVPKIPPKRGQHYGTASASDYNTNILYGMPGPLPAYSLGKAEDNSPCCPHRRRKESPASARPVLTAAAIRVVVVNRRALCSPLANSDFQIKQSLKKKRTLPKYVMYTKVNKTPDYIYKGKKMVNKN